MNGSHHGLRAARSAVVPGRNGVCDPGYPDWLSLNSIADSNALTTHISNLLRDKAFSSRRARNKRVPSKG